MNISKKFAIGIDLGGTNLRVALVSEDGEIVRKIRRPTSENVADLISGSIHEMPFDHIEGIGLGTAGLIGRRAEQAYYLQTPGRLRDMTLPGNSPGGSTYPCMPKMTPMRPRSGKR